MATKWVKQSIEHFPAPFTLSKEKTIPATKGGDYSEHDFWFWASWHPYYSPAPSNLHKDQYYTDGRFIIIRDREYGDGKVLGWKVIDTRYMMDYPDEFSPYNMGQTIQRAQTTRYNYANIDTEPPEYKNRDFAYRHITIPYLANYFMWFFGNATDKLPFQVEKKGDNYQSSFNTLKGARNFVERLVLAEKQAKPLGIINMSFSQFALSFDDIRSEDWI